MNFRKYLKEETTKWDLYVNGKKANKKPMGKKEMEKMEDKFRSIGRKDIRSEIVESNKMAGWIAMYNGKKLEIKKSEADGIYGAKQLAIKKLKVPKSKQGLLAIEPAYDD